MRKLVAISILAVVATFIYLFVIDDSSNDNTRGNGDSSQAQNQNTISQPGAKQLPVIKKPLLERIESSTTSEEVDQLCEELDTIAREHRKLKPKQIERLLEIIKQDRPKNKGISADSWELLMNSSLNAITKNIDPEQENNLSLTLAHLARKASDPVIRLYAMQHIAFWYPRESNQEHKELLLNVLQESARKQDETAGTALTVLSDLDKANNSPEIKDQEISKAALKITNNPNASTSVRVSALHTLCDRNHKDSLSSLKAIASNEKEPVLLRKAAIFGIGKLGTKAELEFLKSLPTTNPRIAAAINPAIQKLSK